jgi:DNA-binding winged helix-turn-helix (wHTH) protein/Tol biopolymer transport system component
MATMPQEIKHLYEFGPFLLDPQRRLLLRGTEAVALTPKAIETLLVLVENRERVVSKDELMKRLWPDSFVEESNLSQNVFLLRKALGDSTEERRYILTVPGRGYQFTGTVREIGQDDEEESLVMTSHTRSQVTVERVVPAGGRHGIPRSMAIAAIALLLLVGWAFLRRGKTAAPAAQYTQLTNYADSATSPALSPDGRMLAFIRGENTFYGPGQVYVKLLPDGEPFQLTNDNLAKMGPTFSPDSARIAYSTRDRGVWDTWIVPVPGGIPRRMLPNASGLTWIGDQRVMFSEITKGSYMKVATATEIRAEERGVYEPPPSEFSMAHRSYLSPDHKSVLVVEMDSRGWLPCRLVPFNEHSSGHPVGPVPSKCTSAAWSPDGNWMYFSADTGSGFHIWRQHVPNGDPEQITSAATEEEGIVVSPDGRSFITSVGAEQSTIWFHQPDGDRQITSEGYAYSPSVSPDGSKIYYLVRAGSSRAFVGGELWVSDTASAHHERLLPGFLVTRYDISSDGKQVLFAAIDSDEKSALWLARFDHRESPRQLSGDASRPFFGPGGTIVFFGTEGESGYIYQMKEDGTGKKKVTPDPVIYLMAVSPDGQWLVAWVPYQGEETTQAMVAYPMDGGPKNLICSACQVSGPRNPGGPMLSWSRDQKSLYLRSILGGMSRRTVAIPLRPGEALPKLSPLGLRSDHDLLALPGARTIEEEDVFPGPSSSIYAFTRKTTRRNLYKIRLP